MEIAGEISPLLAHHNQGLENGLSLTRKYELASDVANLIFVKPQALGGSFPERRGGHLSGKYAALAPSRE